MATEKKVKAPTTTVAELRLFLEQCDALGIPADAVLHAKTGFSWSQLGPRLREITAAHREDS